MDNWKFFVGALIAFIPQIIKYIRTLFQNRKVFNWLEQNSENIDGKRFRSTNAIANGINLTPDRVQYLCFSHKKIRRNKGERETWTIFRDYKAPDDTGIEVWN